MINSQMLLEKTMTKLFALTLCEQTYLCVFMCEYLLETPQLKSCVILFSNSSGKIKFCVVTLAVRLTLLRWGKKLNWYRS